MNQISKVLTIGLIFTLAMGQFARVPGVSERFYIFDIYCALFAFFTLFILLKHQGTCLLNFAVFSFLVFTLIACLSLLHSHFVFEYDHIGFQAFYLMRWGVYFISAFGVVTLIQHNYFSFYWFLKVLLLSGLVVSVLGFVQLIILPDFTALDASYGWDPHKNRLASTFFDPNFVGAYLACCISIYFGLVYTGKLGVKTNIGQFVLFFVVPTIALLLTFSRSAWGMFALIILMYGLLKFRILLIAFVGVGFLVYFAVPRVQTRLSGITDPADSAHFRLESWSNAVNISQTSPLLGVGFNSYRYAQEDLGFFDVGESGGNSGAGADSSFLFILATTGVVGLTVFCLGYFWAVLNSFRHRALGGIIGFAILVSLFFESMFINSIFYPQILLVWLFFAMISYTNRFDISH